MKRLVAGLSAVTLTCAAWAQLPNLDGLLKGLGSLPKPTVQTSDNGSQDEATTVAGIKEALAIGTERAVKELSAVDGYFGNELVKILMPSSIQKVADVARKVGFQKQVDAFTLSMNRAAEAAAPMAASYFSQAIRNMTLQDVRGIMTGGDTAATEFFRAKAGDDLYKALKPMVSQKIDEVGATRAYKEMIARYEKVPFMRGQSVDLDDYVTRKSLDGLFLMVGEEEKKIRSNPVARTTDLLRSVFGR